MKLLGIDTGGTFTDLILISENKVSLHKTLSTPAAPEQAILKGMESLGLQQDLDSGNLTIVHGTTVATNAVLEKKGAKTVFITNSNFKDMLILSRQNRKELFNLSPRKSEPPVPEDYCLEAPGRVDAHGKIISPLTAEDLQTLKNQIEKIDPEAVAINLLFSFLNDQHEKSIEAIIPKNMFISRSSEVLPVYKEYERGIATWLNAFLGPVIKRYLKTLSTQLGKSRISIMQSSGGVTSLEAASCKAVNLLLSGPAGGLTAARNIASVTGQEKILTFDMGGTSTDVALIDGTAELSSESFISDWPVAVPMLKIHTIGAGGGSIAYCDAGGLLKVGPESAGAQPGPACYGQGGTQATVTDANVVLGYFPESLSLGGGFQLQAERSREAVDSLARALNLNRLETAQGIIRLANEHMANALRLISIQKGHDPKKFQLCSFGGAGGLHVCALADELKMTKAIVPNYSGVLSALGMLMAPDSRRISISFLQTLNEENLSQLKQQFSLLEQKLLDELQREHEQPLDKASLRIQRFVDLCYQGQSFSLTLPWNDNIDALSGAFSDLYKSRYQHSLDDEILCVNLHLDIIVHQAKLKLPAYKPGGEEQQQTQTVSGYTTGVPLIKRDSLHQNSSIIGPAIIYDNTSTTWLDKSWQAEVDYWGNLQLRKTRV